MSNTPVAKTRMAPSPTGVLHIGGLRTGLFNYLFAKQHGGVFVLRIEDTDKERSKKEYEDEIVTSFELAGIHSDEFYRQSEHIETHRAYLTKLIDDGYAYVSKEEPKEEGQRSEVIRFKNPNKIVQFEDIIRGPIEVDTTDLGDFVIAKSLEEPLYHLAVVVDDFEAGITHVIRGEEHISNTPRQLLIQEAIGAPRPIYAHLPLILATDRSKLSKRHGAVAVIEYLRQGYLPAALINYLALLGWSPQSAGDAAASDILSLEELIKQFDLTKVQKGGAVFNIEKLNALNQHYIKQLPQEVLIEKMRHWLPEKYQTTKEVSSDTFIIKLAGLLVDHLSYFEELKDIDAEGGLSYYFTQPEYESSLLLGKKGDLDVSKTLTHLETAKNLLENLPLDAFSAEQVKEALWEYATKEGRGDVLWPLRIALSGAPRSPDPFGLADILGKQETLVRISHAQQLLS